MQIGFGVDDEVVGYSDEDVSGVPRGNLRRRLIVKRRGWQRCLSRRPWRREWTLRLVPAPVKVVGCKCLQLAFPDLALAAAGHICGLGSLLGCRCPLPGVQNVTPAAPYSNQSRTLGGP